MEAGTGGTSDGGEAGASGDASATSGEGGTLDAGEAGDAGIPFAAVKPIFDRCVGCHTSVLPDGGPRTPTGNLDMVKNGVVAAVVNVTAGFCMDRKYIDTANPNNSYVLNAVGGNLPPTTATCTNNTEDGGRPMSRMPLNCVPVGPDGGPLDMDAGDGAPITNPCLTGPEVQLLINWIADGALP
jgi:hypothetical protein